MDRINDQMPRKICFVVMPFSNKKTDLDAGRGLAEVDFDALWQMALAPLSEGQKQALTPATNQTPTPP